MILPFDTLWFYQKKEGLKGRIKKGRIKKGRIKKGRIKKGRIKRKD
jgi:hypothetical protein